MQTTTSVASVLDPRTRKQAVRSNILIGTAVCCVASPIAAIAQTYEANELYVASSGEVLANGINASGQVLGTLYSSTGASTAFVIDPNTRAMTLLGPGQPTSSVGVGINDTGAVASNDFASGSGIPTAYIIDSATNAQTAVGTLAGAYGSASAINSSNQIAGWAETVAGPNSPIHAFLTNARTHALIDLGTLGGVNSVANGINNSGQVTGQSQVSGSPDYHAFVTNASTHVMTDLGALSGALVSEGYGINASGQVTGESDDLSGAVNAFVSNATTNKLTDLGGLGGSISVGYGINDSGKVVGYSATLHNAVYHAFVYTGGQMIDLNAALSPAQAQQYIINVAQAINNDGTILANGTDVATGNPAIFLLKEMAVTPPPVPPTFDKAALSFNGQEVNSASSPQTITMTNTDGRTLDLAGIANIGGSYKGFLVASNCGTSLASNTSCEITVMFRPGGPGNRFTTLTITDGAGKQTIPLTGIGVTSPFEVVQTVLDFNPQAVGTQSAAQSVQLVNASDAAVAISNTADVGGTPSGFPFTTACGSSVAAHGVCTIDVAFRPGGLGNRYTMLTIEDGAGTQTVGLFGTGIAEPIQLSTTALPFGNQLVGTTSAAQSITVTNTGSTVVRVSSIANVGGSSTGFPLSNNCGSQITPLSSCSINVSFKAVGIGNRYTTLTVTDTQGTQTVSLSGTGVSQ